MPVSHYWGENRAAGSNVRAGGGGLRVTTDALCSPAFVFLLEEAPEHSFAYFAANDGNKWLKFNVTWLLGATRQVYQSWHFQTPAKVMSNLSCQPILSCPIFQGGLPAHPSLTPWWASSLVAVRETTLMTSCKLSLLNTRASGTEVAWQCGENRSLSPSGLGFRKQVPSMSYKLLLILSTTVRSCTGPTP